MKKIFTFILAAIIAMSFSVIGYAQDKAAAPAKDEAAASTPAPEKKAPAKKHKKHKKHTKAKKAPKKEEAVPAPAPAPAK
jgi:hypothetical protein